jgi:hypothetical protein
MTQQTACLNDSEESQRLKCCGFSFTPIVVESHYMTDAKARSFVTTNRQSMQTAPITHCSYKQGSNIS